MWAPRPMLMSPVAGPLRSAGSYSSALGTRFLAAAGDRKPPATSTWPDGRSVAVWRAGLCSSDPVAGPAPGRGVVELGARRRRWSWFAVFARALRRPAIWPDGRSVAVWSIAADGERPRRGPFPGCRVVELGDTAASVCASGDEHLSRGQERRRVNRGAKLSEPVGVQLCAAAPDGTASVPSTHAPSSRAARPRPSRGGAPLRRRGLPQADRRFGHARESAAGEPQHARS